MKRYVVNIIVVTLAFLNIIFLDEKKLDNKDNNKELEIVEKTLVDGSYYAVMIQDNNGNYNESSTFPTSGYTFNKNKSVCVDSNNNKLDIDIEYLNGKVSALTTKNMECFLYFDMNNQSSLSITSTNNVSQSQTVTLNASDDDGLVGYYFGTENPSSSSVTYVSVSSNSLNKNVQVSASGIYYFSVKDNYGDVTTINKEFFETKFSVENGTVTTTSVITLKGNSFILPTPKANAGYTIDTTWRGNGKSYASGSTYMPATNSTLSANTNVSSYNVTLTVVNGTTTSINPQSVLHGKSATFAIIPNTGYDLILASDTCSGTLSGSTYTVSNVTSEKNCTITLKKKTYTFRISLGNATTSSTNPQTIEHGRSATYVINPKEGYDYVASNDTCGGTFNGKNYVISNIIADTSCTLILKKKTFKVTLIAGRRYTGGGVVNAFESMNVNYGENAVFSVYTDDNYNLYNSYLNVNSCGGTFTRANGKMTYTLSNVTKDMECEIEITYNG